MEADETSCCLERRIHYALRIRFNEIDKVAVKLKKMEIFLGLLREQVLNRVMASAANR